MLCYISFQLYKVITLKRSINGLISVIIFKRTMTNICFYITYLQDNYLGTYVSMNKFMTDTQMAAVLTYLCTLCFLLRASDWISNVQCRKCRTSPFARNCPVTSAPWVWFPFSHSTGENPQSWGHTSIPAKAKASPSVPLFASDCVQWNECMINLNEQINKKNIDCFGQLHWMKQTIFDYNRLYALISAPELT